MDEKTHTTLTLGISLLALLVSVVVGVFQYFAVSNSFYRDSVYQRVNTCATLSSNYSSMSFAFPSSRDPLKPDGTMNGFYKKARGVQRDLQRCLNQNTSQDALKACIAEDIDSEKHSEYRVTGENQPIC